MKPSCRFFVCLVVALLLSALAQAQVLEDFESGTPPLTSYPGQDNDPSSWSLTTPGSSGTGSALRLDGNTWKQLAITPVVLEAGTVWQLDVRVNQKADTQGIGFTDGTNVLFYAMNGRELYTATNWWTVYQGAFSLSDWHTYQLPLAEDWETTFGYIPTIESLVFVNDSDTGSDGITYYDNIRDVTDDLPIAPLVNVLYTVSESEKVAKGVYRLTTDFQGTVFDPDSQTHTFSWDFGDGATSDLQNPNHEFLVEAGYPYTVGLVVKDSDGLAGGDTCQVTVHVGDETSDLTVNFVGDVFTGRGYENSGGIIDTYGVEALFEPTIPIFGDAADVNVANLEVSYTSRGTRHPTKSVVFRSRPENIVGIQYAGVDLVTLGNNHIIDYGEIGMLDTMDNLDAINIPYFGAGVNEYFALQPAFWTEKGVRLAFLGLCNRTGRAWNYPPFLDAGYNKPGFAYLLPDNLDKSIDFARGLSDVVIVQTHSGDEYETAPPGDKALPADFSVEANWDGRAQPDFRFRNEPTPGERELRRAAIDLGADILINHHPHVLQGFESYNGKLIAHSLGNFIFDLYYTETMPTMVLTLEVNKQGITGYRFTPAWINHWIPKPVSGNLSRELMGRLVEYSTPMNALVVPNLETGEARIHLSRADVDSTVIDQAVAFSMGEEDGYLISPPLALAGQGNLSAVTDLVGGEPGQWEVSWGKEILWHTGFEDEGADFWDINTADEWQDTDYFHSGKASLAVRRMSSDSGQTGTDLIKHLPCDGDKRHSFSGWIRAQNTAEARMMARFYNDRYSESPMVSVDMDERLTGDTDWKWQWKNLETPSGATYFEVRCGAEPPASGEGLAWFDDIAFIEWEPWVSLDTAVAVSSPNNYRFLQVRRAGTGIDSATLRYRETAYGKSAATAAPNQELPTPVSRLRCYPNPFNPRTTVELALPGDGRQVQVKVEVFDVRGRRVTTVFEGALAGGKRHGFTWQGRDDHGRAMSSGVYFCKAEFGDQTRSMKMMLVR